MSLLIPTRRLRLLLTVMLAMAVALSLLTPAEASSTEERRLAETQARIDAVRSQIESARSDRASSASSLAEAEGQLATVVEALNAAELAVQRQQQQVEQARAELDRLQDDEVRQRQVMANRAVELYRHGSGASVGALLTSDSVEEAMQVSTYVEVLSRSDRATFERVEIAQTATEGQRRVLEAEEETLGRVAEQQRAIVADVRELRNERALVLAGSEELLRDLEVEERHLEAESREIAALARRASRAEASARASAAAAVAQPAQSTQATTTAASAPAPASGGGWTWPASGPVTSEYGPRWGRTHEGVDIGAGTGAPVVAARAGRVSFAGRMGGYGNLVMVDHGGGIVTAYAHMSAFAVSNGASVSAGQRVGSIGCSGSCTGPHLHFEVRVNGAARNPRGYLP
jgi:septal ring factor EnvC (AmiA/AmiB activator)